MNIVIGMLVGIFAVGMLAKRMTVKVWAGLIIWILINIVLAYFREKA
jgi:hypothetical protein